MLLYNNNAVYILYVYRRLASRLLIIFIIIQHPPPRDVVREIRRLRVRCRGPRVKHYCHYCSRVISSSSSFLRIFIYIYVCVYCISHTSPPTRVISKLRRAAPLPSIIERPSAALFAGRTHVLPTAGPPFQIKIAVGIVHFSHGPYRSPL